MNDKILFLIASSVLDSSLCTPLLLILTDYQILKTTLQNNASMVFHPSHFLPDLTCSCSHSATYSPCLMSPSRRAASKPRRLHPSPRNHERLPLGAAGKHLRPESGGARETTTRIHSSIVSFVHGHVPGLSRVHCALSIGAVFPRHARDCGAMSPVAAKIRCWCGLGARTKILCAAGKGVGR